MPQKLNSAGKMQDYIPAGNGDASGEYGNNKGTRNKHAKIENGKVIPNIIEDNNKDLTKNDKKETKIEESAIANVVKESVKDKIDKINHSSTSSEDIEKNIKYGTQPMQEFIELAFDNPYLKIHSATDGSYVSPYGSKLYLDKEDMKPLPQYEDGQILYHELGHTIDAYYSEDTLGDLWASCTIKLSDGKTLQETLRSENTYNKKNNVFDAMDIERLVRNKALLKQYGYYQKKQQRDEIANKIDKMPFSEYKIFRDSEQYKEYQSLINDISNIEDKVGDQLKREFGDLSDIRSSQGLNHYGMAHDKSYWRFASNKPIEFFAECVGAKATNPRSWALLKKYYPKSTKAFEELCDIIKSRRNK